MRKCQAPLKCEMWLNFIYLFKGGKISEGILNFATSSKNPNQMTNPVSIYVAV